MPATSTEKRPVKVGIAQLDQPMTQAQAKRYGDKNMTRDLKKAGFQTFVGVSDKEMHGGLWFRVDYGMTVKAR